MAPPRLGEVGPGPLWPAPGPRGKRIVRRIRGVLLEVGGFVAVTVLLPLLVAIAAIVDVVRRSRGRPAVALRLALFLWWFLAVELWSMLVLLSVWTFTGGPFGGGSMRRRRGVYWLRPRWARGHLGGFSRLFGISYELEGIEAASPGPYLVMIRHASIVDNLLPDTKIALPLGMGIRYVVKRELELLPLIDIGGRWITTNFLQRASGDAAGEIGKLRQLVHGLGPAEAVLIYPEGTRATAKKIARVKQIIAERQPELTELAEPLEHLLPPRLGGPLALIEEAPQLDVVFFAHAGFDGYERIGDLWRGGLVGATIKIRLWRVPASEIPTDEWERTLWLYEHWQRVDDWVAAQLGGRGPGPEAAVSPETAGHTS